MAGTVLMVGVAIMLALVYCAAYFSIWWPTWFGIEGVGRAVLAYFTLLALGAWLIGHEWEQMFRDLCRWIRSRNR